MISAPRFGYSAIVATFILFLSLSVFAFWPGNMSSDSLTQLGQAQDARPLTDWHPPIMALTWKVLIILTTKVGSMAFLQLSLLWGALLLTAFYIYRQRQMLLPALCIFIVGLLPNVVNLSGIIWKDTLMAYSLLLATAIAIWLKGSSRPIVRYLLISSSILLILYAVLLRYNAVLAALPLLYLVGSQVFYSKKIILFFLACGLTVPLFISLSINTVFGVAKTHPSQYFMIDDIRNVSSKGKNPSIVTQHPECQNRWPSVNAYWVCFSETERDSINKQYPAIKSEWLHSIASAPTSYAKYKIILYWKILVQEQTTPYIWHDGIDPNDLGVKARPNIISDFVKQYVYAAHRDIGLLFRPITWLSLSIILSIVYFKKRAPWPRWHKIIFLLAISSLLYSLTYLPLGASYDYRYFYWCVLSLTYAGALLIAQSQFFHKPQKANPVAPIGANPTT